MFTLSVRYVDTKQHKEKNKKEKYNSRLNVGWLPALEQARVD